MNSSKNIQKNAIVNVINKIVSTIFPFLSLVIVTRRLGSENYGTVVFCESIIAFFLLFASLGTASYGTRECASIRDDKNKTNNLINRLFSFNVITSLIVLFLLILFIFFINLSNTEKTILAFFSIEIIFSAFNFDWIYKIYEDYSYIAFCKILSEIILFIALFLFIKKPEDYIKFVVIRVCSSLFINILRYSKVNKFVNLKWTSKINCKEFIYPIIILFASSAMISIYFDSDLIMLGYMRGSGEVGIYKVASKIYMVVLDLINSIGIVMMPRMSYYIHNKKEENNLQLLNKMFQIIILMTIPATIGIILISNDIIPLIFGEAFINGAHLLKIVSISLLFGAMNNLFINVILISQKKDGTILKITTIGSISNVLLNIIMIRRFGMYGAAITTLISEIVVFICSFYKCNEYVSYTNIFKSLLIAILICIVFVSVCNGVNYFNMNKIINPILKIVSSIICYVVILSILKKKNII